MRSILRGAVFSVLGVLFLASALFAQTLTVRVPRGNVRARPATTSPIIGKIKKGEQYDVEARRGDWFKILLETGQEGWVFKSLVGVSGKRTVGVMPVAPATSVSSPYGNSWAVIIGIDQYKTAPGLQYAVNDARSIAAALPALGFPKENIFLQLNEKATRGNIVSLLGDALPKKVKADDRLFVFFAGHGATRSLPGGGNLGYLVPYDGDLDRLHGSALSMRELRDISRLIPAKHIFYAVDACYSGLLLERAVPSLSPTAQGYLEVVTKRRVRQILTAGLKDQPVLEEAGHGVFTRRLLEGLNGKADQNSDGIITGLELGSWVASRVASSTENRQTPTFGTIEGDGQFVFMTARAVDPLYAERRNLKRMRAGLVRLRREAEEAKRMALEAARLTLEQGKRLADERRELEKLKREVASQTEIQERLRKTRLQ